MQLYIKNMVCSRCKMVVKSELEKFGLHPVAVALGAVEIAEDIDELQKHDLNQRLRSFGFELIDGKKGRLVEKIKNLVVELVYEQNNQAKVNLSELIAQKLQLDYSYISHIFTEEAGLSIEQYYIIQKIEKVKELITYHEYSLSEIANQLNYSSVSHLSKQFKKVTGLTASHYRQLKESKRISIENL